MELSDKEGYFESAFVKIEKDRVIRKVENLEEAERVLRVADEKNFLGKSIIDTKILYSPKTSSEKDEQTMENGFKKQDALLEHRKIKHILHSGEYTESMAYDVTKLAIDLAVEFVKSGIYAFDLHPHNFTFENGNWILYDFGALRTVPAQAKTQIRSVFKISFSAFELSKIKKRSCYKHYYLNRIKTFDLLKMISFPKWLSFTLKLRFTQIVCLLGLYEQAYKLLKRFYDEYEKDFHPLIYEYNENKGEDCAFKVINNLLEENNLSDIFCIGEFAGKWAIKSSEKCTKFVYFDDYELCDKYYNYLKKANTKNISTGVLYPMMTDEKIPENWTYRALYDYFAQERFKADAVVMDLSEIIANCKDFCENLSHFADKCIIAKCDKNIPTADFINEISKYFAKVTLQEEEFANIILATEKIDTSIDFVSDKLKYKNNNRMQDADLHSAKILEILGK